MSQRSPLEKRRAELIAMSNLQRDTLVMQAHLMRESVSPVGISNNLLETVKQHKWWLIGGALALVLIKPRRMLKGLEVGVVGLEMWKHAAPMLQKVRAYFDQGRDAAV